MVDHSYAQDIYSSLPDTIRSASTAKVAPKGPKPIKHEVSLGYRVHTNGWGAYLDIGKVKAKNVKQSDMFYNVRFWQVELTEKKHPKQEKLVVDENASGQSGSYIYGKMNNFYGLKLGYGIRRMIAGKPDPGSVSIHWVNVVSASLGMLKPYYLSVKSDPNAIKFSDATKANFMDQTLAVGSAGFAQGLSELKMIPGGAIKSALHFDFAANRKSVLAVETGINFEYYSEPVPLMVNQEAVPYFCDLFISLQFGKRW